MFQIKQDPGEMSEFDANESNSESGNALVKTDVQPQLEYKNLFETKEEFVENSAFGSQFHESNIESIDTGEEILLSEEYSPLKPEKIEIDLETEREDQNVTEQISPYSESFNEARNRLNSEIQLSKEKHPFSCQACGKSFSRKNILDGHLIIHSGARPFSCEICGVSFSRKQTLNTHVKIHKGNFDYVCKFCSKTFYRKGRLNAHVMINHTGERPLSCEVCSKSFSTKMHLNSHMITHVRPFVCEKCNKPFSRKDRLRFHLMNVCTGEKSFSLKYEVLMSQMAADTSDPQFLCKICEKSFESKDKLRLHSLIHS